MFIYKIENKINNKVYIGKTKDCEARWKRHQYLANKGESQKHLYVSMRKYGINNFVFQVIEECDDSVVNKRERYWIKQYNATDKRLGYNHTEGGEGGDTWALNTHKEETSKKISEKRKGHTVSLETRSKISAHHKGRSVSLEQRKQISETLKEKYKNGEIMINPPPRFDVTGLKHSEESKRKMSEAHKGKSYEEFYGIETANKLKELRREHLIHNNPNYRNVDKDKLYEMLCQGKTDIEIATYFNVTYQTIISKCKKYFNKTPSQVKEAFQ